MKFNLIYDELRHCNYRRAIGFMQHCETFNEDWWWIHPLHHSTRSPLSISLIHWDSCIHFIHLCDLWASLAVTTSNSYANGILTLHSNKHLISHSGYFPTPIKFEYDFIVFCLRFLDKTSKIIGANWAYINWIYQLH